MPVIVKDTKKKKDHISIKVDPKNKIDEKLGDFEIKIYFSNEDLSEDLSVADMKSYFAIAFAENEEDLVEKTVSVELGMSIEEALSIKGEPKSRVNLGKKTILTYDDIKLIFEDGVLTDAQ